MEETFWTVLPDSFGNSQFTILVVVCDFRWWFLYKWHIVTCIFPFKDRGNDNWLVRYEKQDDGLDLSDKVRKLYSET